MSRGQFVVLTILLTAAVLTGAVAGVAVLGPWGAVSAQELQLAPPPSPASAVVAPSFADLAERAIPSVVLVRNTTITREDPHAQLPFFRRFFREPFGDGQAPERAPERRQESSGSGFFITEDGYLLTNRHVVDGADRLEVWDVDDNSYPAKLVGIDPALDLALLKVEGKGFPALPLGDSEALRVGEWVVAIGNPIDFRSSVTVGVVSGKGRQINFDPRDLGSYIQTDAAINFGNSGGPLLNARGEVVGINTAIIRGAGNPLMSGAANTIQGIGFALPISKVKPVLDQLVRTGTVKRGYLGVSVQPVDEERADYLGLDRRRGAYVARVEKGMPADKAGIQEDDVILAVDGNEVKDSAHLVDRIASKAPGETVKLTIWRDGHEVEVSVELGVRPTAGDEPPPAMEEEPDEEGQVTDLGISVTPLPRSMRESLEKAGIRGVLITHVDVASNAYEKGLREGQVLMDINDMPVRTLDEYRKAAAKVKPGQVVKARIAFSGGDKILVFFRAPSGDE
ncbi:MAG: Do family serine endopeptidase [Acidobacteriota bacterium]|nr:Do family serine endopeptidase [Acidobacteriota bacterium]MDQ7088762.1 Do family serine endopeptidase [Acidobacteriota bacterium]